MSDEQKNQQDQDSGQKTVGFLGIAGILLSQIQIVVDKLGLSGLVALMVTTAYVCTLAYYAKINQNGSILDKFVSKVKNQKKE